MYSTQELKERLFKAGREAVNQLIEVAAEDIMKGTKIKRKAGEEEDEYAKRVQMAADKLKQAASTKKMAIFDAFDILDKLDLEEEKLKPVETKGEVKSFAERRAK